MKTINVDGSFSNRVGIEGFLCIHSDVSVLKSMKRPHNNQLVALAVV